MFLMSFLALTHLILIFFKRFSDLSLALNFQENDVKHENKKYFFLWPYGENAATSGGRLALFQYLSSLLDMPLHKWKVT